MKNRETETRNEAQIKAAEPAMKNAYAGDICDSVNTLQEATALMSDEDEVLEVGGFHIKQWTSSTQGSETEDKSEIVIGG